MRLLINKDIEIVSHNSNEFQEDLIEYVSTGFTDLCRELSVWFEYKKTSDQFIISIQPQKITLESIDINSLLSAIEDINYMLLNSDQFSVKLEYIHTGQGCDLSLEMSIQKEYA